MKYKASLRKNLKIFRKQYPPNRRDANCPFEPLIDRHKYCAELFPRWAKECTYKPGPITMLIGHRFRMCPCNQMTTQHIRKVVDKVLA